MKNVNVGVTRFSAREEVNGDTWHVAIIPYI